MFDSAAHSLLKCRVGLVFREYCPQIIAQRAQLAQRLFAPIRVDQPARLQETQLGRHKLERRGDPIILRAKIEVQPSQIGI
jgi:hypothetical protein